MNQTEHISEIQKRMKPGVITLHGFLGNDTRDLADILSTDDEEVRKLGFTHDEIAMRMMEMREAGMRGLGEFVSFTPHFEVCVDSNRGKLPCPFGDPGIFPKNNTTVKNLELQQEITYTDLNIHLILAHGFYQGKGSPFRLEPAELIKILEVIKKEKR